MQYWSVVLLGFWVGRILVEVDWYKLFESDVEEGIPPPSVGACGVSQEICHFGCQLICDPVHSVADVAMYIGVLTQQEYVKGGLGVLPQENLRQMDTVNLKSL